jgi:hypothetical protein
MYDIVSGHKKTVIERASELINVALSARSVSKWCGTLTICHGLVLIKSDIVVLLRIL